MPNYNSGYLYNADGNNNGLFYNSEYRFVINIKEVIGLSEDISKLLATYALRDNTFNMYDTIVQTAIYGVNDKFNMIDTATYSSLFQVTDRFGVTDEISTLLVLATIYDKQNIIDEVKQFNELLVNDEIEFDENTSVTAFVQTLDRFGLKDLSVAVDILFTLYDKFSLIDGTPRSATSDFVIGVRDDLDNAYDWLIPFDLKVDWNTTSIQVMPEASNTLIEMPGVDGSIVEDTVYKDRLFQIVAFSDMGLNASEKQELKSKITEILDATKHQSKKLTVQASDNSFDVKYDGQAVVSEGPSYVKATIPFRTSPYGYRTFEGELHGNGLVNNEGDAPIGVKHTISGPVSNPSFTLGDIAYSWTGNVPSGSSLVINHEMMTCYLQDQFGVKKNAMTGFKGTFQKIPAHKSVALTATGTVASNIYTTWRDKVLW